MAVVFLSIELSMFEEKAHSPFDKLFKLSISEARWLLWVLEEVPNVFEVLVSLGREGLLWDFGKRDVVIGIGRLDKRVLSVDPIIVFLVPRWV